MVSILIGILRTMLIKALSKKVIEVLVLGLLEKIVKHTDNKLDDEVFIMYKKGLK